MALEDFQKHLATDYRSPITGGPLEPRPAGDYATRLRGLSAALAVDVSLLSAAEIQDLAEALGQQGGLDETWTSKRRGDAATALRRLAEFKLGVPHRVLGYNPLAPGRFIVAVTDLRWHAQLLETAPEGLVNFWTPTLWKPKLGAGSRLYFMLKSPVRRIGGYGHVVAYEERQPSDAWRRWGLGNGVQSADELEARVAQFADKRSVDARLEGSPIGCIVLRDCVFLDGEDQRSAEELGIEFPTEIVKYKRFHGALVLPIEGERAPPSKFDLVSGMPDRTASTGTKKLRAQQAVFRAEVLSAYGGRCAFMGTPDRDALDAAHIQGYVNPASNHVQNGLALRKDVHALFDAGLLALSDERTILVSSLLSAKPYKALAGRPARRPADPAAEPSIEAIRFHRRIFRP